MCVGWRGLDQRAEALSIADAGGLSPTPDCRWNRDLRRDGGGGGPLGLQACGGMH